MARTKPSARVVADHKQADAALAEIGRIDRELAAIEAGLNETVDAAKAEAAARMEPLKATRKELGAALQGYATVNKAELFSTRKSLDLVFGMIGFRKSTKLKTKAKVTWAMVLGKLKDLGLTDGIRVSETVNRDELRTWPKERLDLIGAMRVESDEFFFEVNEERIAAKDAA